MAKTISEVLAESPRRCRSEVAEITRTYTIWGNGGKYEWLIRDGERITARSNPIYNSYGAAKRAMVKALSQPDAFND